MIVERFHIEESTKNKGCFVLIAELKTGEKFVVSGDPHFPTYLQPYDACYYTPEKQK